MLVTSLKPRNTAALSPLFAKRLSLTLHPFFYSLIRYPRRGYKFHRAHKHHRVIMPFSKGAALLGLNSNPRPTLGIRSPICGSVADFRRETKPSKILSRGQRRRWNIIFLRMEPVLKVILVIMPRDNLLFVSKFESKIGVIRG